MTRHLRLAGGAAVLTLLGIAALTSLVWTPGDWVRIHVADRLKPPLAAGLLGTDPLGRDVLSLLMVGARNSLSIAIVSIAAGALLGISVGLTAAARDGGRLAFWLMRACDLVFAFPAVISALMLGALLGPGRPTTVLAIAIFSVPVFARVARGAALEIWARPFVTAARVLGKGRVRISVEHVLPNIFGQLVAQITLQFGLAILTEAGLSYIGLGLPPPAPSWGRMLAEAQTYLAQAPHLAIAPGCAIALTVLGFNLLGDGLDELADPRRRTRT